MKQPLQFFAWKPLLLMLFLSVFSFAVWAQEGGSGGGSETKTSTTTKSTNVSITDNTAGEWYTSPWVWVVGAAVFILLLVALLSNRGRDTESVRVSKTVERDSGNRT